MNPPPSADTRRPWLPWVGGALVALTGAGALVIMWVALPWSPSQLTWPDYRAGSVGDALLLPILTGTLIRLNQRAHTLGARPRPLSTAIASCLGGIAGAAVQWLWLADPQPSASWTFIAPHRFSIVGVWHALFFTAMSALIAGLWTQLALRWAQFEPASLTLSAATNAISLALLLASAFGFAGLVVLDSVHTPLTLSSLSSVIAIGCAAIAVVAIAFWPLRRQFFTLAHRVLQGMLIAAAVVAACTTWPPKPQAAVLGLLCVGATWGWMAAVPHTDRSNHVG